MANVLNAVNVEIVKVHIQKILIYFQGTEKVYENTFNFALWS